MGEPTVSAVRVHYQDNGKLETRTVKFNGNFGFSLNGKEYTTKNGVVYNSDGKPVAAITMPKTMAYQFVGMSNTAEVSNGVARDYTFAQNDMETAKEKFSTGGNKTLSALIVGTDAVKGAPREGYANYHQMETPDGAKRDEYSTNYHYRVSIWQE